MANPPIVYHYHRDTGVYLNASSAADPDPMDEDNWLYPANSTTKIPPRPYRRHRNQRTPRTSRTRPRPCW